MTARALPEEEGHLRADSKSGQQKKGEEQKKGLLQAGLAMGALRFAATLLRPMVISYVTQKFGGTGAAADGAALVSGFRFTRAARTPIYRRTAA